MATDFNVAPVRLGTMATDKVEPYNIYKTRQFSLSS
jgi:hypothetical protein